MIDCSGVRVELDAFVRGELAVDDALAVEDHLRRCASCRSEQEELLRLSARLASLAARMEFDAPPLSVPAWAPPRLPKRAAMVALAVAAAWSVFLTVVVLSPEIASRITALPTGKVLREQQETHDAELQRASRAEDRVAALDRELSAWVLAALPPEAAEALGAFLVGEDGAKAPASTLGGSPPQQLLRRAVRLGLLSLRATVAGPSELTMRLQVREGLFSQERRVSIVVRFSRVDGAWKATLLEGTWPP